MLTFFRRIRKGLVDGGKTRRYLVYAVGEVALVVIGILIALQINNWNEGRKTKVLRNEYLQNIKNDIIADTISINATIVYGQKLESPINKYHEYFDYGKWTTEEIMDSAQNTRMSYLNYNPRNSTTNEMLSGGHTKLLNEQLRRALSELKTNQDHLNITR